MVLRSPLPSTAHPPNEFDFVLRELHARFAVALLPWDSSVEGAEAERSGVGAEVLVSLFRRRGEGKEREKRRC